MKTINERRSIRQFKDRPVESEKIEAILKAAMQAPSSGNQKPWEFIVVKDTSIREKLSELSPYASPIKKAPVAIVLLGNMTGLNFQQNWSLDMAASAENMLLEIVEQDLGAVWLGVTPEEDRMAYVKQLFDLPDHVSPFCVIALGYPKDDNANHFIERYDEKRVHYNSYNGSNV